MLQYPVRHATTCRPFIITGLVKGLAYRLIVMQVRNYFLSPAIKAIPASGEVEFCPVSFEFFVVFWMHSSRKKKPLEIHFSNTSLTYIILIAADMQKSGFFELVSYHLHLMNFSEF